jgi:hypothetical protein
MKPTKYLDRSLKGVKDLESASFEERSHCLFTLEMAALESLSAKSAMRAAAGEAKCMPSPLSDGTCIIGSYEFRYDELEEVLVHESLDNDLMINLNPKTLRADAEKLLFGIKSLDALGRNVSPLKIIIGTTKSLPTAIGGCDPDGGRISFYADNDGGLLAVSLEDATCNDPCPVRSRQVVAHELSHALERNPEVQRQIAALQADLLLHAESGFESPFGQALDLCARSINSSYLPERIETWKIRSNPPAVEMEAANMASEFWAELCAAEATDTPIPSANLKTWDKVEALATFITANFSSLRAGPKRQKLGIKNAFEKEHAMFTTLPVAKTLMGNSNPRIDYIPGRFLP